jgi:hypothetical protein
MRLAETYIHVEFSVEAQFDQLARTLEEHIVELAKEIFLREVKIEYLLEEGTLIERTKVIGKTLAVLLGIVAGYHELRESIIHIYKDARSFGEVAIEQFHKITNAPPSTVISRRMISPDVNRLYRIIHNTDLLQTTRLSQPERRAITDKIISDIAGLYWSNPQDNGVQILLNNLPKEKIPELPNTVAEAVKIEERRRRSPSLEGNDHLAHL